MPKPPSRQGAFESPLKSYITKADPTWKDFVSVFIETNKGLKSGFLLKNLSRRHLFPSIRSAYMGIVWRELSIDLVAAALRQREFTKKIVGPQCAGFDSPSALYKANTRYHKFLLLIRPNSSNKKAAKHFVPTLDIDLCWHTHQLFPVSYRAWCIEHIGTAINHDDTVGSGDLNVGLRNTSLAWCQKYREPYTTDDLRGAYFSKGRKIVGTLFPPYGLYMLRKGQKLKHARMGTILLIEQSNYSGRR